MKWIFLLSLLLAGSVRALEKDGFEYSDSQIAEMEAALRALDDLARKAAAEPSPALIPELGNGVFKTSHPSIYAVGDRLGVRRRLKDVLLAIPGHVI